MGRVTSEAGAPAWLALRSAALPLPPARQWAPPSFASSEARDLGSVSPLGSSPRSLVAPRLSSRHGCRFRWGQIAALEALDRGSKWTTSVRHPTRARLRSLQASSARAGFGYAHRRARGRLLAVTSRGALPPAVTSMSALLPCSYVDGSPPLARHLSVRVVAVRVATVRVVTVRVVAVRIAAVSHRSPVASQPCHIAVLPYGSRVISQRGHTPAVLHPTVLHCRAGNPGPSRLLRRAKARSRSSAPRGAAASLSALG